MMRAGGSYMLYIGVDLGTSAVKLLLMDSDGKIKNIVSKEIIEASLKNKRKSL